MTKHEMSTLTALKSPAKKSSSRVGSAAVTTSVKILVSIGDRLKKKQRSLPMNGKARQVGAAKNLRDGRKPKRRRLRRETGTSLRI